MTTTMIKADADVLNQLNGLLMRALESKEGYETAKENITSENLKKLFTDLHLQRARMINDLEIEIRALGGEPTEDTSFLATAHQKWIDLKGTITNNKEEAIIKECIRGERIAKEAFQKAGHNMDLLEGTRNMVQRHYGMVNQSLESMKRLAASFEAERAALN